MTPYDQILVALANPTLRSIPVLHEILALVPRYLGARDVTVPGLYLQLEPLRLLRYREGWQDVAGAAVAAPAHLLIGPLPPP